VDSAGDTIDFLLSAKRDADAAKRLFQKALRSPSHPRPRVINVDGNPCYPKVIEEFKRTRELGRCCRCWPVRYLNNVVETGSSGHQTSSQSESGISVVRLGLANDSRN
jgi:transposase-like protein